MVIEQLHRARTTAEVETLLENTFAPLHWVSSGARAWSRALAVQRELAAAGDGRHRRPALDYIIAATAELAGADVVLWGFDRDMAVICEHTGQPCELESAV